MAARIRALFAAQSHLLTVYYALLFALTFLVLAAVVVWYVTPKLGLEPLSAALMMTGVAFQQLCTFFPESGSEQRIFTHRLLAGISAASLAGFLASTLAVITAMQQPVYGIVVVSLIIMALIAVGTIPTRGPLRKAPLIAQLIFYGAFFAGYFALIVA